MAEEEKKDLLGSETIDRIYSYLGDTTQSIYQRAQEDDPTSLTDEAARLGVGTAEFVGNVAGAPVIKQTLQALDLPFYLLRQGTGGVLEHGFGVDPRVGHLAVGTAEVFVGGKGIVSGATKGAKLARKGAFASRYAVQETIDAARAARLSRKGKFWRSPNAGKMSPLDDAWKPGDITGPKKTYTQTAPRTAYPDAIPPDPWNPPDLQAHLFNYIDSTADVAPPVNPSVDDIFRIQEELTGKRTEFLDQYTSRANIDMPQSRADIDMPQMKMKDSLFDDVDNSLSPSQTRDWSKYERDQKAYFLEERWPRDNEFNDLGKLIKKELETIYPDIPLSYWRRHHTNPLAQGAKLLNGLKPEFREKGVQIMISKGLSVGHNPEQLNMIPTGIHEKIHRFINSYVGRKFSVRNLELTYFNGADISTIPWKQREIAVIQYANVIRESNEKIYDLMTALAVNKKYGPNVIPEVLAELNSKVDDVSDIGLDDLIKQIDSEFGLQKMESTVPKINVLKLAQQWMDDPIKKKVLQAKMDGATRKQLIKRFGKKLDIEQLDVFDQMTPQQYQMLQKRYGRGGKGGTKL